MTTIIKEDFTNTLPALLGTLFIRNIYKTVTTKNLSYLALVVGKHRMGKSFFAVTLASILDPTFEEELEKRVVYDAKSFMDACKEIEKRKIKGAAIVWDEAGVGLSSRDWFAESNKAINYSLQVLGYLNPFIFFVTQDLTFLDAQPKKLLNNFFEMNRPSNEFSVAKPFDVHYDKKTGQMFFYYPRIYFEGALYTIKQIYVPKLIDRIAKRYEMHSRKWKEKIILAMSTRVEDIQTDNKTYTIDEIKEEVKSNIDLYLTQRGKVDWERISLKYQLPYRKAKVLARDIMYEMSLGGQPKQESESNEEEKVF